MASDDATLDDRQRAQLRTYRDLLLDWNRRINLTAIKDPVEVERRLFGDALRMLPAVDTATQQGAASLVDVGTGAGFPGLPLKIARPWLDLTLVEATGKKVAFLHTVIERLELEAVTAIHGRAEDLGQDPVYRERFDIATARAVAALPALLELCLPLLRLGGCGLFPKAASLGDELADGRRVAPLFGGRIIDVTLLPHDAGNTGTRLVIAAKVGPTPRRYPRRAGLPASQPLGMETATR